MAVYGDKTNFSWGVGASGGNTNNWDDNQWQSFWKDQGLAPTAPAAPAAPTTGGADPKPQPITTAGQTTATQATVGGKLETGAPTTVAQSFQQGLINKLNPEAVSAQSSQIAPAIQANQLGEQRGFDRNRNMLAERAAANGTSNSGGFESQLLGMAQDRAGREAQFEGNAVRDLGKQVSAEQMAALGLSGGLLGGNQSSEMQKYGVDTQAALQREGLGVQSSLGGGDLALRGRLGEGQLNLGLLGLLQGGSQFDRSLSQQGSQFGAGLDQQGLLALLGLM